MKDLAADLEALAEKATPGPWVIEREVCDCGDGYPCHEPYPTCIVSQTATFIQNPDSKEFRREVAAEVFNIIEAEATRPEDAELVCLLRNNAALLCAALRWAKAHEALDAHAKVCGKMECAECSRVVDDNLREWDAYRSLTEAPRRGA